MIPLLIIGGLIAAIWGYLRLKKLKDDANQVYISIVGVKKPNLSLFDLVLPFDIVITLGIKNNSTQSVTINDLHGNIIIKGSTVGSFAYPTDISIASNQMTQQYITVTVNPLTLGTGVFDLIKGWAKSG